MSITRGIILGVCGAVAALIAFRTLHSSGGFAVATAVATRGPIARQILTTGTLESAENIQVGAQVTGVVQALDADFDSIVRQGQVLAKLDPATFDAALESARAQPSRRRSTGSSPRATSTSARRCRPRCRRRCCSPWRTTSPTSSSRQPSTKRMWAV